MNALLKQIGMKKKVARSAHVYTVALVPHTAYSLISPE
jgi:hypothetical protein